MNQLKKRLWWLEQFSNEVTALPRKAGKSVEWPIVSIYMNSLGYNRTQHSYYAEFNMKTLLAVMAFLLAGCVSKPQGIEPVANFDSARYLGKWYEIARLDHSFERGLSRVSAEYSMRDDGGIKVINRGYNAEKKEWKESEGKAYFVEKPDVGYLKVSFFGPFYGSYIVFDLDREKYGYSLVSGPDRDNLWLLSRTPTMDEATKKRLVDKAQALGFNTSKLIYVDQSAVSQ